MKIAILMSTYNGDKYIQEQIDSILNQKEVDLEIIIRDDGSSDRTTSLIKKYISVHRNIKLIEGYNVGCEESFNQLCLYALENSNAEYFAFCDQDDVWMPNKIYVALKMLENYDDALPNLYFSNLSMVTENLMPISDIFRDKDLYGYNQKALIQIFTYGCTCVFNKVALKYYCKPKKNRCFHDHWIFVICSLLGNAVYDRNSYILYRQHTDNLSGKKKKGIGLFFQRIRKFCKGLKGNLYENLALQMLEEFDNKLSVEDKKIIFLLTTYRKNYKVKLKLLFSKKYRTSDRFKNICIIGRIMFNHL